MEKETARNCDASHWIAERTYVDREYKVCFYKREGVFQLNKVEKKTNVSFALWTTGG